MVYRMEKKQELIVEATAQPVVSHASTISDHILSQLLYLLSKIDVFQRLSFFSLVSASGTVTTTIGIGTAKRRRRSLIASSRTFTTEDAFTEVKYAFRQVMASYFSFPFKDIDAKWKDATNIDVTFKIRDPSTISALETSINKANTDQTDLNKKMQAVDSLKTYKIDSVSEAAASKSNKD